MGGGGTQNSHVSGEDAIDEVLFGQMEGTLQLVIVEGDLSWTGAVEPGLHERGPRVLQQETAPYVILAHPGHPRVHCAPTIMFYRILPKEEICKQPNVKGCHKIWLCGRWREEDRAGRARLSQCS